LPWSFQIEDSAAKFLKKLGCSISIPWVLFMLWDSKRFPSFLRGSNHFVSASTVYFFMKRMNFFDCLLSLPHRTASVLASISLA
jgi:hypothetical protein